jgi:hypothetical protein
LAQSRLALTPNKLHSQPPLLAVWTRYDALVRMPGAAMRRRKFPVTFTWIGLMLASFGVNPATAQVVIPYGTFENDFESYLVAIVSFVLLCFAAWRFFRRR